MYYFRYSIENKKGKFKKVLCPYFVRPLTGKLSQYSGSDQKYKTSASPHP